MENNASEQASLEQSLIDISNILGISLEDDLEQENTCIDKEHRGDLALSRRMISQLLKSVEDSLNGKELTKIPWGPKDNEVGVVNKLSTTLIKIIPLERNIRNMKSERKTGFENIGNVTKILNDVQLSIIGNHVAKEQAERAARKAASQNE